MITDILSENQTSPNAAIRNELFTPFNSPIASIIRALKGLVQYNVHGVKRLNGELDFYLLVDDKAQPKFLIDAKEDEDELYDTQYFRGYEFSSETDTYIHAKMFFIALVSLCQCSTVLDIKLKHSMLRFTEQALQLKELPFPNFWSFNSGYLLDLLDSHRLIDYEFE